MLTWGGGEFHSFKFHSSHSSYFSSGGSLQVYLFLLKVCTREEGNLLAIENQILNDAKSASLGVIILQFYTYPVELWEYSLGFYKSYKTGKSRSPETLVMKTLV